MQKSGKNLGGYLGETIDVRAVLRDVEIAAEQHGWQSETLHTIDGFKLSGLHHQPNSLPTQTTARRVYLSAGIHGDEPAGPLAALELIRDNRHPANLELWLCPCLNPTGFIQNRRANSSGLDLNRDYRNSKSAEVRAHIAWLERRPNFDLYLCLHEDWESHGFYLYAQNPDSKPSLAEPIMEAVKKVCPIDLSENIEGRAASGGIIRPNINPNERPDWPEAFYLITHKSRQGYTLEAPSDFPLATRVTALTAGARAAMEAIAAA